MRRLCVFSRFGKDWSADACFAKYQKAVGKGLLHLGNRRSLKTGGFSKKIHPTTGECLDLQKGNIFKTTFLWVVGVFFVGGDHLNLPIT